MRLVVLGLALGLLLCSCASTTGVSRLSAQEDLSGFLQRWLRSDPSAGSYFCSASFSLAHGEPEAWPKALRALSPIDRVLAFPSTCSSLPDECSDLSGCIGNPEGSRAPFHLHAVTVEDDMVQTNPGWRPFLGRRVLAATFVLKGCNVGVVLLIDPKRPGACRILSASFFAG